MRTHSKIITDAGASKVAHALKERGVRLATNTPQRWAERDSIPSQYWPHLCALNLSTSEELFAGDRPRKALDRHADLPTVVHSVAFLEVQP